VGWVDGFHAQVESEDEVIEVEPQSQSVGSGELSVESVETELSAGLFGIVSQRPDVAGVDEESSVEFPAQECAIFEVEVEFHIAGLIDEVDSSVGTFERAGAEFSDAPTSHGVGSAGEVSFFEGQDRAVAIGIGHAQTEVQGERVAGIEVEEPGEVGIHLGVLCVGDVEERVFTAGILLHAE